MRTFVSVDVADLADEIAAVQSRVVDAAGIRPTDPGQAHVTLKFLGETDEHRLSTLRDELAAAVRDADVEPFEGRLAGLGAFPSHDYISVVWIGVDDDGHLARLHDAIEARTVAMGFEPEEHDFTPHVTIARMDHAGGKEHVQRVLRSAEPTLGTTTVTDVRLVESTLTDDGPVYEPIERLPLG